MTRRQHLHVLAIGTAKALAFIPVTLAMLIFATVPMFFLVVPVVLVDAVPAIGALVLSHAVGVVSPTRGDRLYRWGDARVMEDRHGDFIDRVSDVVFKPLDWLDA